MPRWPDKEVNAAEQDLGVQKDLVLPATGPVIRDDLSIEIAEGTLPDDYAKSLAFMEEKLEVLVHESTDPNADNPVLLACNGVNQFFVRGQPQLVKRKYVEILARSKTTAIATREVRDYQGDLSTSITKATALRYPFSIVRDENPQGAAWLRSVLQQG
jgi:hypothetical protein